MYSAFFDCGDWRDRGEPDEDGDSDEPCWAEPFDDEREPRPVYYFSNEDERREYEAWLNSQEYEMGPF